MTKFALFVLGTGRSYRKSINTRKRTREEAGLSSSFPAPNEGGIDSKRRHLNIDPNELIAYLEGV
jgi:hypothetical protein